MKKSITINMFGCLYAIDEDAYELLNKYMDNLRSYFGRQEGGVEIAEDIERRIAELFGELVQGGVESITIEHVQEIISRIGKPEEMDDGNCGREQVEKEEEKAQEVRRKLYRDTRSGKIGGVLMGFSHYFGGDVRWWRVALVLLCIFPVFISKILYIPLIYVILWIVIPEAVTAEDYLKMMGKPITPDSIGETVVNTGEEKNRGKDSIVSTILKIAFFCFLGLLLLLLGLSLLAALIVSVIAVCSTFNMGVPYGIFSGIEDSDLVSSIVLTVAREASLNFWWMMVSIILFLGIPFFCIIHHIMTLFGTRRMAVRQRILWCVAGLLSLLSVIGSSIMFADKMKRLEGVLAAEEIPGSYSASDYMSKNWERCYEAFEEGVPDGDDDDDFFVRDSVYNSIGHLHFVKTWDFTDINSSSFSPGIYRMTVRAFSNMGGLTAFVRTADSSYTRPVPYGSPERVTRVEERKAPFQETHSEYHLLGLPEVVIDSIVVSSPGDLEYGIKDEDTDNRRRYVLYSAEYKIEKVK